MFIEMIIAVISILVLQVVGLTYGQTICGVCDTLIPFRCVNSNTAQLCNGDQPVPGGILSCPRGTVCSINSITGTGTYCQVPTSFPSTHDCESQCIGICPAPSITPGVLNYICLGPNSYRICNEFYDDVVEHFCPVGQICTIDSPCISNTTAATQVALCPKRVLVNPDPNNLCIGKLDKAKYPLSPPDPFCEKYLYCRYHKGTLKGTIYTCPKRQQFNQNTGRCERAPVAGCRRI